jgi:hypothetical protein
MAAFDEAISAGSSDILSADLVGAKLLGHEPENVP